MATVLVTTNNGEEFTVDTEKYLVRDHMAWTIGQSEDADQSMLIVASMVHLEFHGEPIKNIPAVPDWDNALLARDVEDWPMASEWEDRLPTAETIANRAKEIAAVLGIDL